MSGQVRTHRSDKERASPGDGRRTYWIESHHKRPIHAIGQEKTSLWDTYVIWWPIQAIGRVFNIYVSFSRKVKEADPSDRLNKGMPDNS